MLHGPKIFSFYFGFYILNFLLLHIKVLRKQPNPFWNSWLLPLRAAPHNAACPDEFPMCTQRDAPHRCEPAFSALCLWICLIFIEAIFVCFSYLNGWGEFITYWNLQTCARYLEKGNATRTVEGVHNCTNIQERGKDQL